MQATRRENTVDGEEVFSCQATELVRATSAMPWWRPGQYVRDVRSGNASVGRVIRSLLVGLFNKFQKANARVAPGFGLIHGAKPYPFVDLEGNGHAAFGSAEPAARRPRRGQEQKRSSRRSTSEIELADSGLMSSS